ncbi:hypothetical protein ACFQZK_31680 [Rhodococcus aetherivorans]
MRGDRTELTARLTGHGFDLPGEHRHRLLVSPLSGRIGGHVDVWETLAGVQDRLDGTVPDREIVVGIDDGTGDIAALAPEVGALALPDGRWALLLDGTDSGVRLPPATSSRRWSRRRSGPAAPASPRPSRPWAWSRRSRRRRTRRPRPGPWDGSTSPTGRSPSAAVCPGRCCRRGWRSSSRPWTAPWW